MKNKFRLFGIIALAAVIIFSITACPPAVSNAGVQVRALNNNGTAPPGGRSAARAAGSVGTYGTNTASFNDFTTFYTALGTPKAGSSPITPSIFMVALAGITFHSSDGDITVQGGLLDFAQGTTITVNDVPNGVTCTGITFEFGNGITDGWAQVRFPWPGGFSAYNAHNTANNNYYGENKAAQTSPLPIPAFTASCSSADDYATILMSKLFPHDVSAKFSIDNPSKERRVNAIKYDSAESQRKYGMSGQFNNTPSVTIPCNAVPINGSVTFTMSWDLTGMIEVYEGASNAATDDILVLKKDFWESLYLSIN